MANGINYPVALNKKDILENICEDKHKKALIDLYDSFCKCLGFIDNCTEIVNLYDVINSYKPHMLYSVLLSIAQNAEDFNQVNNISKTLAIKYTGNEKDREQDFKYLSIKKPWAEIEKELQGSNVNEDIGNDEKIKEQLSNLIEILPKTIDLKPLSKV